eukprot:gene9645-7559_t
MPATINEPTSLLQRLAESFEYYSLLDRAAEEEDEATRLMLVATFVAEQVSTQPSVSVYAAEGGGGAWSAQGELQAKDPRPKLKNPKAHGLIMYRPK